jgi:hypothetical protein
MPQLSYSQNAIIAQPGMVFDGDVFDQKRISRICSAVCPFGSLVEMDANGLAQPVQDATTLSGTVTLTNASASITFSTAQTLAAGQAVIFSDQPSVVYYLAAAVAASTAGTLTVLYSGTGGAGKLTSTGFSTANLLGVTIFDPMGEEEDYTPWSVPVTLAGTVTVTNASASVTFSTAQTLKAGTFLVFSAQPGVPYVVLTTTSASTTATLTVAFSGTGGAGGTTTSNGGGSTCPGYKIGRAIPILRAGRIWGLGDATGTTPLYGPINVHHSSTGANPQGVFTYSAVSLTVGNEIDVATGVTLLQPGGMVGFTAGVAPTTSVDPFGNSFSVYPIEVRL